MYGLSISFFIDFKLLIYVSTLNRISLHILMLKFNILVSGSCVDIQLNVLLWNLQFIFIPDLAHKPLPCLISFINMLLVSFVKKVRILFVCLCMGFNFYNFKDISCLTFYHVSFFSFRHPKHLGGTLCDHLGGLSVVVLQPDTGRKSLTA